MTWIPTHDDDGEPIAELNNYELRRRIANLRTTDEWRSRAFRRAYELVLKERTEAKEAQA